MLLQLFITASSTNAEIWKAQTLKALSLDKENHKH